MNLCINCAHYIPFGYRRLCARNVPNEPNPVDGTYAPNYDAMPTCDWQRRKTIWPRIARWVCGPEGKYFQEKVAYISPPPKNP